MLHLNSQRVAKYSNLFKILTLIFFHFFSFFFKSVNEYLNCLNGRSLCQISTHLYHLLLRFSTEIQFAFTTLKTLLICSLYTIFWYLISGKHTIMGFINITCLLLSFSCYVKSAQHLFSFIPLLIWNIHIKEVTCIRII